MDIVLHVFEIRLQCHWASVLCRHNLHKVDRLQLLDTYIASAACSVAPCVFKDVGQHNPTAASDRRRTLRSFLQRPALKMYVAAKVVCCLLVATFAANAFLFPDLKLRTGIGLLYTVTRTLEHF